MPWAPLLSSALAAAGLLGPTQENASELAAAVRPLLSDRCFPCHGPDAASVAADLRLDLREDATADLGGYAAIVPGDAAASELIRRITHEKPRRRMPPPDSKLSLSEDEIELLHGWIEADAPYAEHWSFVAPARSANGPLGIDGHTAAKLAEVELEISPEADPATLLRRVSYDLAGLPPTVEELEAFLADPAPDRYERAVERLLATPAHAERLTAHWLDVARYADTFGYQADVNTNVWPWRDWVLRAFEANLPYDDFVVQQLAGDLLPDATRETRLATAFNRLHRQTNEGGSVEEEFRVEYVCDRVETMAGAFLGLTVGCARCHDHKFDPLSQRDYFGLFAFFDGIDESGLYSHFTNSTPTPALDLPTPEQEARLAELEKEIAVGEATARRLAPESRRYATRGAVLNVATRGDGAKVVAEGDPPRVDGPMQDGPASAAVELNGDQGLTVPGVGHFARSDPFSIGFWIKAPERFERAVVLHRSRAWTDSGSRGYQLLIEDGRLTVALVHFWPGDAIAIRGLDELAVGEWQHVLFTYDGSSRASGLHLYLGGQRVETEVVRDRLTRTIQGGGINHLTIGSRFRDNGFKGGQVAGLFVHDGELDPEWGAPMLALKGDLPLGNPDEEHGRALEALRTLRAERDKLRDRVRQVMTMREGPVGLAGRPGADRQANVLGRGEYTHRDEPVDAATPAFLPQLLEEAPRTRLDLARWLVHPEHPLTARVHVDRLWRLMFGRGLVASPEDFGSQCPPPLHRELLDELALDLIESGWDTRALLRRIVQSHTYRQSSVATEAALERDPGGERFSRYPSGRLPAEMVRDGALRASGLLAQKIGGKSVMPYQPLGLWQEKSGKVYRPGWGEDLVRRSLYTFWRRTSPPPTLAMFDAPSREVCRVARPSTTTPLQALALWNDPQFVAASVALGARAAELKSDEARIEHLFLSLASRRPSEVEAAAFMTLLDEQRSVFEASPDDARALATFDLERFAHSHENQEAHAAAVAAAIEALGDGAALRAALAVTASAVLSLEDVTARR